MFYRGINLPEITPTSILDPLVEGWAKEAGMTTENLSNIVGGNFIGGIAGVPMDMFLTQLGSKLVSFAVGAAGLLFGTYSMKGKGRMQRDTMQISARILTEFLDPSPSDVKAIQRQIRMLVQGVTQGRFDKVAYSLVRSPQEFAGLLPSPPPKPPAQKKPEKPPETKTPPKKTGQPTYPKGPGKVHKL
jgi:hypothetical protein